MESGARELVGCFETQSIDQMFLRLSNSLAFSWFFLAFLNLGDPFLCDVGFKSSDEPLFCFPHSLSVAQTSQFQP